MPQPIQPHMSKFTSSPAEMEKRPECAIKFAQIIANWSIVEQNFRTLYGMWLGDYMSPLNIDLPPGHVLTPSNHPAANLIFDRVISLQTQLDLVTDLCKWREEERYPEFRDEIRPMIMKAGKKRNDVAHGIWGTAEEFPDGLVLLPTFGENILYRPKDFDEILRIVAGARSRLGMFTQSVWQKRTRYGAELPTQVDSGAQ